MMDQNEPLRKFLNDLLDAVTEYRYTRKKYNHISNNSHLKIKSQALVEFKHSFAKQINKQNKTTTKSFKIWLDY